MQKNLNEFDADSAFKNRTKHSTDLINGTTTDDPTNNDDNFL